MIDSFRDEYFFLSNFYSAPVIYKDIQFKNSEAAFQAAKCKTKEERLKFKDLSPNKAKALGRRVDLIDNWEDIKTDVMREIVEEKFSQNPILMRKLLATGDEELVEGNNWNDRIWGVCDGMGENRLGEILMDIRSKYSKILETKDI